MTFHHPIYLNKIKIKGNIFAAPLAGITNLPTRLIFSEFGADLTFTEMVSANGIVYEDRKTIDLLIDKKESNSVVQIFGSEPYILADAVKYIEENTDYKIINLNMGCPVKKILKSENGGFLLRDEKKIKKIFKTIKKSTSLEITIKIRAGWDNNSINFLRVAKIAKNYDIKMIILHPRTVKQMFTGSSNWKYIKELKKKFPDLIVIGNGDIKIPEDAKSMIKNTNCDGIMIARASIGFPWIFSQIKEYFETGSYAHKISTGERMTTMLKHLKLSIDYFGERKGIKEFRIQLLHYTKNFRYSSKIRSQLQSLEKFEDIINILKKYNLI